MISMRGHTLRPHHHRSERGRVARAISADLPSNSSARMERREMVALLSSLALLPVATGPASASQATPATVSKYLPPSPGMDGFYTFVPQKDATPVCAGPAIKPVQSLPACMHGPLTLPSHVPSRPSVPVLSGGHTPSPSPGTGGKSASRILRTGTTASPSAGSRTPSPSLSAMTKVAWRS